MPPVEVRRFEFPFGNVRAEVRVDPPCGQVVQHHPHGRIGRAALKPKWHQDVEPVDHDVVESAAEAAAWRRPIEQYVDA